MHYFVNKKLCFFLLFALQVFSLFAEISEKPIVVLSLSYNNSAWCQKSVLSILDQEYSNYRIVYVNDHSSDDTGDKVETLAKNLNELSRFTIIHNEKRLGPTENFYRTIHEYIKDEEIIVNLDGDDWFFDNQVLKKINAAYSFGDVWLTHGTMIEYPSGNLGWSIPIPPNIIKENKFREFRCPSHVRTFYAWLFKKIKLEDFLYKENQFFPMTADFVTMLPMIEMAGERHAFISDITYVYNMTNPINENKIDAQLQRDIDVIIRNKPRYSRLKESLKIYK